MAGDYPIPRKDTLAVRGLGWAWWHGAVMLECTNGHRVCYDMQAHKIDPAGVVTPSTVCPEAGCTFHVWAKLSDWRGDEGPQATAPAGPPGKG